MITYRATKGFALTHEELDDNFREFDDNDKALSVGTLYCPIGDKYVFDIAYGTDKNYALVGASPYVVDIMGASTQDLPFNAVVNGSTTYNHSGAVIPLDISGFTLVETVEVAYPRIEGSGFTVDFAQEVDLIEVEWDASSCVITNALFNTYYVNGEVVNPSSTPTVGVDYYSLDLTVSCKFIAEVIMPLTWNDTDPFGDGSQIHYFKFENNLIDENSNGTVSGTASYSSHSLVGNNALKLVTGDTLTLPLLNTNMLTNNGYSYTCGFSTSAGSDVLGLLEPVTPVIKHSPLMTFKNALTSLVSLDHIATHFYNFILVYTTVTERIEMSSDYAVQTFWHQKCSDNQKCSTNNPSYASGWSNCEFYGGRTSEVSGGWSNNGDAISFVEPTYPSAQNDPDGFDTVEVPTTLAFMENGASGAEAEIDELRIFDRPLKPSEGYMLSNLLGQTMPIFWSTDGGAGHADRLGTLTNFTTCALTSVLVNGVYESLGTATANSTTFIITNQYRLAYKAQSYTMTTTARNTGAVWYGENCRVRGYKKA